MKHALSVSMVNTADALKVSRCYVIKNYSNRDYFKQWKNVHENNSKTKKEVMDNSSEMRICPCHQVFIRKIFLAVSDFQF